MSPFFVGRDIIAAVKTLLVLVGLAILLAACGDSTTPTMQSNTKPAPPAFATPPPNEQAALDALHKVAEAQSTYFKINRRYALTYDELVETHLLNSEPSAAQTGYDFKLRPAADAQAYTVSSVPSSSGSPVRHFFLDQTGVIRAETGKDATSGSPAVK